ncbi:MAG TPA: DUF3108 domain-containing protein [Paracoccaceae bacterium]|nr:DUF3108 domain-containing protein [Paracoccaceae bacterium]
MGRKARGATLLALALMTGAGARADGFGGVFDIYLGGLHGAELRLEAAIEGERFAAQSELRTTGLVEIFYEGFYRVSAEGRVEGERLVPAHFRADSAFGGDRQRVSVTFGEGGPVAVEADPGFKPRPWAIDPAAQAGTFDPLSAAIALLRPEPAETVCSRTVDIFDGRRRSRITLGAPVARPGGVECPATYERVAGFSPKTMRRQTRWPFTARFQVGPDGVAAVRELFGDTGFGLAVVRRRG